MSMARKDAFIKWYLAEKAKSSFESGSKPTISQLRQNALKYGYEIRTVTINGAEVVKIRWNEKAQFETIDDFITNHQAKLWSNYLDLEKRLSICGVSVEKKHNDDIYQSEPYRTLQQTSVNFQLEKDRLARIIQDFGDTLAKTRKIDWSILKRYDAALGDKWRSEFIKNGKVSK